MEYPRGISSCRRLINLVRKNSIPFVVLLEPRASVNNLDSLKSFLGFNDFIASPNKKIWILWRSGFHAMSLSSSDQLSHLYVSHDEYIVSFRMTFVYAKSTRLERLALWDELRSLAPSIGDHPWLIGGDFNLILLLPWRNILVALSRISTPWMISMIVWQIVLFLNYLFQEDYLLGWESGQEVGCGRGLIDFLLMSNGI